MVGWTCPWCDESFGVELEALRAESVTCEGCTSEVGLTDAPSAAFALAEAA